MRTALTIRAARGADVEEICRLHQASIRRLCSGSYDQWQIEEWTAQREPSEYEEARRTLTMTVADNAGELVGFSILDLDIGCLHALYVHPDRVGRGIGGRLLAAAVERFRSAAVSRIWLHATLNSVGFYEAHDFVSLGPATNVLPSGVPLPCVAMEKELVLEHDPDGR